MRAVQWLAVVSALLVRALRVLLMVSALVVRETVMVLTRLAVVRHLIACLAVVAIVVADFSVSTKTEVSKLFRLRMMALTAPAGCLPKWRYFQKTFARLMVLALHVPAGSLPRWHFDQKILAPTDPQMAAYPRLWHRSIVLTYARLVGCLDRCFSLEPWLKFARAS